MLTGPQVVAEAVRSGLVTPEQVLDGSVTVADRSRSNEVLLLTVGQRAVAYVKQRGAASRADGDDAVLNEARAATALAGLGFVPRVTRAGTDAVWLEPLPGAPVPDVRAPAADLARLCGAWGATTARLHRWPVQPAAPEAPRPWPLRAGTVPESVRWAQGPEFDAVLAVLDEPDVHHAVAAASERWTTSHWVHGDLSAANVLACAVTTGTPHVHLVDLETAGTGSPAWDLAKAASALTVLAPQWHTAAELLVEHFLAAYDAAGGPGRPDRAMQVVEAVTVAWRTACGVHTGETDESHLHHALRHVRDTARPVRDDRTAPSVEESR